MTLYPRGRGDIYIYWVVKSPIIINQERFWNMLNWENIAGSKPVTHPLVNPIARLRMFQKTSIT